MARPLWVGIVGASAGGDTATRRSKPESYCGMEPLQQSTGDPAKAYDAAEVRLERIYKTPVHHHSAIETPSAVAAWETRDGEDFLLVRDGTAEVRSATHEIGSGVYTVFRQIAGDALAMPIERVRFDLGGSGFPDAPIIAGSRTTASVGAAVLAAGRNLVAELRDLARRVNDGPLSGAALDDIVAADGRLSLRSEPARGEDYGAVLRRAGREHVAAEGALTPDTEKAFALHSFVAIFAEVRVDVDTGVIRVTRLVGVFDVGCVINPRTSRSQLMVGMIAGLGGALSEEAWFDPNNGRAVIRNLADYHAPSCADAPAITVEVLGIPDPAMGKLGARGLSEMGTNNMPAAIGNALLNATGRRLRGLPLTPDRVLEACR